MITKTEALIRLKHHFQRRQLLCRNLGQLYCYGCYEYHDMSEFDHDIDYCRIHVDETTTGEVELDEEIQNGQA